MKIKITKIVAVYTKDKSGVDLFEANIPYKKVKFSIEGNDNVIQGKDFSGKYLEGAEIEGEIRQSDYNGATYYFFNEPKESVPVKPMPATGLTLAQLAYSVEIIRIQLNNVLEFIEQYKAGKIPADFSTERVEARKEQLEKAQAVVGADEINPEDIPF